jgi:hypothetical protein
MTGEKKGKERKKLTNKHKISVSNIQFLIKQRERKEERKKEKLHIAQEYFLCYMFQKDLILL